MSENEQLKSISSIFGKMIFRIPDYQRGFAWSEKQLKDFWNDLIQLEKEKNHYAGVLTLENVSKEIYDKWEDDIWIISSKKYKPYYIVDGQQRLTTIIILIQCITKVGKKKWVGDNKVKLNYTSIEDIQKNYIFDSKDDGISRSYIFGYEKDNPSYEFLKVNIFEESSSSGYNIEETIYTHNLTNAKNFFINQLDKLTLEEIEIIFTKVTENVLFNLYTISNDIDVFVTFETMNNRGKPLSQLELLKNRLIFLSTKLKNIEDYESITIRKVINDSWKAVYHYLGKNKDFPLNDDKFLETHFSIYFDRKKLFDEIDKKLLLGFHRSYEVQYFLLDMIFTIKNVKIDTKFLSEYVSSLKSSVKIWYYLHNPYDFTNLNEDEKLLFEKIDRIEIHNLKVIVLTAFLKFGNIESQERTSFLKTLEKFGFFLLLSPMKRVFVKDIEFGFFEAARNLYTGSENLNSLKNKMDKFLSESKNKPELLSSLKDFFKSNGFYEWDGIQYFLFEYELFLKSKSKSKKIKINWRDFNIDVDESNSIEHIYPQTATDIKWKLHFDKYTPRERKVICNSLGNLVALSKQKNSSLRNKPFEEKVSNDNNTVGYRYGCYSENEITRFDKWTAVQILARSLRLIKFMNETWDLTIGNNDLEKASFLNLEFVIQKESLVLTQENNIDFGDTFLNDYVLLKELNAFT